MIFLVSANELFPHGRWPERQPIIRFLCGEGGKEGAVWELAGRICARRKHSTAVFLDLRDASGEVQLIFSEDPGLDIGDIAIAQGHSYRTSTELPTLRVDHWQLLAKTMRTPPDRRDGVRDLETRLRHRELDLLANRDTRALFRVRAEIVAAIREWLNSKGYLEIETPILQSLAGGSSCLPFRTHYNALKRDLYLSVSPELYLNRALVGGLENVYALGKSFRNEGISPKHSPEFVELEWMMSYCDYTDVATATEEMIRSVAQKALGRTTIQVKGQEVDLAKPWQRITMRELIQRHLRAPFDNMKAGPQWMEIYTSQIEPTLIQPTFVFDFPLESFPITKRHPQDPRLGEHFDAVIGGMEIVSGDTELNDPDDQYLRFAEQQERAGTGKKPRPHDEEYANALRYGYSPTAGGGMGIDRLVMLLTERESIREVIPFPMLRDPS
jgi:lysyl-tRNA synthetase class 2